MKIENRRRPFTATSTDTTDTTTVMISYRLPFTRDVVTVSRQELCAQIAEILEIARKLDRYQRKHATERSI